MRIIITYASVGSGHFRAAQAIYNYLKQKNQNLELKLIDVLEHSNFLFRNVYIYGYTFLINYALRLWSLGFYITYNKTFRPIFKWINFIINRLNIKKFEEFLIQNNPDFIISTHFLPAEISTHLKRTQQINSQLLTVITDFGAHPFWINEETDIYVAASDYTKENLLSGGIPEERIKVLGIPIDSKFLAKFKRNILLNKFNIGKDKFSVLIVTGSFGVGPIEKLVDLLYKEVRIFVVCARNKRLFFRLKKKNYPEVYVFGFIDNIEELMVMSDIIITKPGGLSICELLARELVPIFIYPIPGQETTNIKALENYGIGLTLKCLKDIKDIVLDYKNHPDKLNKSKANIRKIKKTSSVEELYNVICKSSIRHTS